MEVTHSVKDELNLSCGCALVTRPSAFASVSVSYSFLTAILVLFCLFLAWLLLSSSSHTLCPSVLIESVSARKLMQSILFSSSQRRLII